MEVEVLPSGVKVKIKRQLNQWREWMVCDWNLTEDQVTDFMQHNDLDQDQWNFDEKIYRDMNVVRVNIFAKLEIVCHRETRGI